MSQFSLRTARWKALARRIKERDEWRCVKCRSRRRLQVDHIRPLHKGGVDYDPDNLQTLCEPCHSTKTARETNTKPVAGRQAWLRRIKESLSDE